MTDQPTWRRAAALCLTVAAALAAMLLFVGSLSGCRGDAAPPVIQVPGLTISTTVLPAVTAQNDYSSQLVATGGTGEYSWEVAPTSPEQLPEGLSLSIGTGAITGRAVAATIGAHAVAFRVSDGKASFTRVYGILVVQAPLVIPFFGAGDPNADPFLMPQATELSAYTLTLPASGGGAAYHWRVTDDSPNNLPPALELNDTGLITGVPAPRSSGEYHIKFELTAGPETVAAELKLVVVPALLSITKDTLPIGIVAVEFSEFLAAQGGSWDYTWGIDAASAAQLPPGLALNTATGEISGTPTGGTGIYNITFSVTDLQTTTIRTVQLQVVQLPVDLTSLSVNPAVEGAAYSFQLEAYAGSGTNQWSVAGNSAAQLPAGLTLNAATGLISGTPDFDSAGTYVITFQVGDGAGSDSAVLTLTVTAQTPTALLDSLAAGGGGWTGGALQLGDILSVRVVDATTHAGIAGITVVTNNAAGAVTGNSTSDAGGNVGFSTAGGVPSYVTVYDPLTNNVEVRCGTAANPLREDYVITVARGPKFAFNITGIPAGNDVVVKLNGETVFSKDAAVANESFNVTYETADDMKLGSGVPFLIAVMLYTDATPGTVDTGTLAGTAWLSDSNGANLSTGPATLTLDAGTGTGSTGNGVTPGLAATLTVGGTVTRPALAAGDGALLRATAYMVNSFGTWDYTHFVLTPLDPFNMLPPLGPSYAYVIQYPDLSAVSGGAFTANDRLFELFVTPTANVAQIINATHNAPCLRRRVAQTGVATMDVDLSLSLPALNRVAVYTDLQFSMANQASDWEVVGHLLVKIDANTSVLSTAIYGSTTTTHITFGSLAGSSTAPLANEGAYVSLEDDDGLHMGAGVFHNAGPATYRHTWVPVTFTVSGTGDTGTPAAPEAVDFLLGAAGLTLTTNAFNTPYVVATDTIGWVADGLDGLDGAYSFGFDIPTAVAGVNRHWNFIAPVDGAATPVGGAYSFIAPQLPAGVAFDAGRLETAAGPVDFSLEFIALGAAGINPGAFNFGQLTQYDGHQRAITEPSTQAAQGSQIGQYGFASATVTPQ